MRAITNPEHFVLVLLLTLVLAAGHAAADEAPVASSESSRPRECPVQWQGHVLEIRANCTWGSAGGSGGVPPPASSKLSILGSRPVLGVSSSNSATPVVYAAAGAPSKTALQLGVSLNLERLVLVGFQLGAPDSQQAPVLWPGGLVPGNGEQLNMTDVRLVINSQEIFNKYLTFFTAANTLLWTDNTNFIHIHQWSNGRTLLRSVGILMGSPAYEPGAVPVLPSVKNCLYLSTNATLLSALIPHAAVATPLPLLVYLSSNVTIGQHPPLPTGGVIIKRPVVFVGLQSQLTSIDFEMVVNQLNLTGSQYSNTTFVGAVLENLAPGDIVTSAVAAPFSIAITNNLWAVLYNRSAPHQVRWALHDVTMVLPQESEMSYVTYMFTLYNSPLQYFKQQTQFYSDVLHMTQLQFTPGPGNDAITVSHLYSMYHRWGDVILTTVPLVAKQLPLPNRPVAGVTSTTKVSPLVQPVRTEEELRAFSEQPVVGEREHILLFLSNVSLPAKPGTSATTPSSSRSSAGDAVDAPLKLASAMTWVGYSPGTKRSSARSLTSVQEFVNSSNGGGSSSNGVSEDERVALDCGHRVSGIMVGAELPKDALQLQQLVLTRLPQGSGAMVPATFNAVPASLFTLMLWSFARPGELRSLYLIGVTLLLPQPELDYIKAFATINNDFVIEMSGTADASMLGQRPDALTFANAYDDGEGLSVEAITGPGFQAMNVTLRGDPDAVSSMPGGYLWPETGMLRLPRAAGSLPQWVMAVIAVCVTLAAVLMLLGGFLWWQRKRICVRDPEAGELYMLDGSSDFSQSKTNSHCHRQSSTPANGSGTAHNRSCSADCSSIVDTGLHSSAGAAASLGKQGSPKAAGSAPAANSSGQGTAKGCDMSPQRDAGGTSLASTPEHSSAAVTGADTTGSSSALADNVAAGMQRWRAAVSSTTMLLMERRMDAAAGSGTVDSSGTANRSTAYTSASVVSDAAGASRSAKQQPGASQQQAQQPWDLRQPSGNGSGDASLAGQQMQLQELLGQGSFGSVFLAMWRGKRVAVKVMQLPASALLDPGEKLTTEHQQPLQPGQELSAQERRRRLQRKKQQNSPPHMAIMEAVVSSTMSHPNVVQVFTYMLSPLTSSTAESGEALSGHYAEQQQSHAQGGGSSGQDIAGWSLKLVMEYCDEGSLRDALDCNLLSKPGGFLAPSTVLALSHDIAAAMLHLHCEGIVHGDLKAGNVMLTSSSGGGGSSSTGGLPSVRMWSAPGDKALTAKVADFGLALPLGPTDTHATLLARGTPTHMAPELLISGHLSKASDVYAYGILLFEIITGKRAYAGVPIPLLPHEVARQGLRPEWPQGLPPGCRDLKKLAQACWSHDPGDRPTFEKILQTLDIWSAGGHGWPPVPLSSRLPPAAPRKQQQQQQQVLLTEQQQQRQPAAQPGLQPPRQQQQQPSQSPSQQQQQREVVSPGHPPSQQQQQQQQQTVPRMPSVRTAGTNGGQGRNIHMSWSEVEMNEDYDS